MSGFSGNGTAPIECEASKREYLAHAVYHDELLGLPVFDPIASTIIRHRFLMECPGALRNIKWVEHIDLLWGAVPYYAF